MSHLIHAVVHNTGATAEATYVKRFESKSVFEEWLDMVSDHIRVVKWWWDRPPCQELAEIRERYADTWLP